MVTGLAARLDARVIPVGVISRRAKAASSSASARVAGRRRDGGVVAVHAGGQARALIDKMELTAELHRVGRTDLRCENL